MKQATKLLSCTCNGVITSTSDNIKPTLSAHTRIEQLVKALGIYRDKFNEQASYRKYDRLSRNIHFGINS